MPSSNALKGVIHWAFPIMLRICRPATHQGLPWGAEFPFHIVALHSCVITHWLHASSITLRISPQLVRIIKMLRKPFASSLLSSMVSPNLLPLSMPIFSTCICQLMTSIVHSCLINSTTFVPKAKFHGTKCKAGVCDALVGNRPRDLQTPLLSVNPPRVMHVSIPCECLQRLPRFTLAPRLLPPSPLTSLIPFLVFRHSKPLDSSLPMPCGSPILDS